MAVDIRSIDMQQAFVPSIMCCFAVCIATWHGLDLSLLLAVKLFIWASEHRIDDCCGTPATASTTYTDIQVSPYDIQVSPINLLIRLFLCTINASVPAGVRGWVACVME
jgi:hypothetical protein